MEIVYDDPQNPEKADVPQRGDRASAAILHDEYLMKRTFQTDPKAGCEMLFQRYYTNLCSHAVRFVHSKAVAEDIVSEIFSSFWQNRTYEQINTSFRAYLFTSVRHRAYNYVRWQMQREDPLDQQSFELKVDSHSPEEILQLNELHQKIERIVQEMPPQCRKAYVLKRIEGKKYNEIADELQISSKAVEGLISRALNRLREGLKDEWGMYMPLLLSFSFLF